jgi:hypothetical protein
MQQWVTPTPVPTLANPPPSLEIIESSQLATSIVGGWQQVNSYGLVDIALTVALLLLVIGGIWSIIRHVQRVGGRD